MSFHHEDHEGANNYSPLRDLRAFVVSLYSQQMKRIKVDKKQAEACTLYSTFQENIICVISVICGKKK